MMASTTLEDDSQEFPKVKGKVWFNGYVCAPVNHADVNALVAELMQFLEATQPEGSRLDSQKALVKKICRNWMETQYSIAASEGGQRRVISYDSDLSVKTHLENI
jgi:hypothetical protein